MLIICFLNVYKRVGQMIYGTLETDRDRDKILK